MEDLFDDFWPEIESEILYRLRLEVDFMEEYKIPEKKKRCCMVSCFSYIRAKMVYALYPCKQIKLI